MAKKSTSSSQQPSVLEPTKAEWVKLSAKPAKFKPSDSGIKFFVRIPADWLKDSFNPKNWREHPARQRKNFDALVEKVGLADTIKFNRVTGKLFDGHMRLDQLLKHKGYIVVQVGDWSEEQEDILLSTMDPLAMQAKTNAEALRNLTAANKGRIEKVTTEHQARLKQIQEDLDARASAISEGKESAVALPQASKRIRLSSRADEGNETEDDDGSTELSAADSSNSYTPPRGRDTVTEEIINEDVFFDASNRYAIPDLLMSRLGTVDDLPTATYHRGCSIADQERNNYYYDFSTRPWADKPSGRGVLGFYCEDHRFNGIDGSHGGEFTADAYRAAADFVEELKEMDFATIISPDFSTYHKWPLAMRIWSVYRSRWCARYWQEMGFTVIPSIQSLGPTGKETDTREFALDTLPVNIPAIAVQCRKTRKFTKDMAPFTKFLTLAVKTLKPEGVVIYGGEENQKYIHGSVPKGPKYIYLPSFVRLQNKQRGKVK